MSTDTALSVLVWVSIVILCLQLALLLLCFLYLRKFKRKQAVYEHVVEVVKGLCRDFSQLSQREEALSESIDERLEQLEKSVESVVASINDAAPENIIESGQVLEENFDSDERFKSKIMALIEAHYQDPLYTPAKLIEDSCMSRSLFHRKSTTLLGLSAGRLINSFRMEKAKAMILSHPSMNISDVAYSVGFNDPKYFTRYFTKYYGESPSKISPENIS